MKAFKSLTSFCYEDSAAISDVGLELGLSNYPVSGILALYAFNFSDLSFTQYPLFGDRSQTAEVVRGAKSIIQLLT